MEDIAQFKSEKKMKIIAKQFPMFYHPAHQTDGELQP
jgi:hypothetical protein